MGHNLKLRAQVDFIAKTRCRPVLVGQAVQAHHDYLALHRGNGWEHQIEKNVGIGIQLGGDRIVELAWQHDIRDKLSISPEISWTNWRGNSVLTFGFNLQRSFGFSGSQ